jgi:hypothetical protein
MRRHRQYASYICELLLGARAFVCTSYQGIDRTTATRGHPSGLSAQRQLSASLLPRLLEPGFVQAGQLSFDPSYYPPLLPAPPRRRILGTAV